MRRLTYLVSVVLVIIVAGVLSSVVTEGFRELEEVRRESRRLELRREQLQQRVVWLRTTLAALDANPKAVEALARRELGWVRPDETVYLLTTPTPAAVAISPEDTESEPVLSMPD